ncbi:hypothetical protein PAEPH01_1236 [Pancytospora epiphaga]|nr:hypothetical protein PAEPH01_1236 [Pancytospora epiphaga]
MGSFQSKPKSHWDILGITQNATLPEIKRAYCKLAHVYKNNSEMLLRVNDAYTTATREVPYDLYTPDLLDREYDKYAPDFFTRLELCYGLRPRFLFTDGEFIQFYRYWLSFRHEDDKIETKVRAIVRLIKARDPRVLKPLRVGIEKKKVSREASTVSSFPTERQIKTWKYSCKPCNKGFNSENTLKDHLKSKKHIMNEEVIRNNPDKVENCVSVSAMTEKIPEDDFRMDIVEQPLFKDDNIKDDGETIPVLHGPSNTIKEHEAYRTCHYCKEVFLSRGQLILHIRETH